MELDDLKEKWKASNVPSSTVDIREALERKVSVLKSSGRGIRRVFYIELIVALLGFVALIMLAKQGGGFSTWVIKLMVATLVGSTPLIWRLFKAQRWANSIDFSENMRKNMTEFVRYYKTTLRIYHWSCYVVIVIVGVLMFTDENFMALGERVHTWMIVYLACVAASATPYIWFLYGRRIKAFEDFLRD